MKLLVQSALITIVAAVVLGLATGAFAFQRVANWGQANTASPSKLPTLKSQLCP